MVQLSYPWASLVAQLVKTPPVMRFDPWVRTTTWRRDRLHTAVFLAFPDGSDGKESACNAGDLGSIPGLERSPGEGHGNPLQYSSLKNTHGQRSLVGYSSWGHRELDMTEQLTLSLSLPWKESYDKPRHHIRKQISLCLQSLHNQSYGFSSSHVRCESWNIMKAECQRINAFILWCWRRLLKVPWTARRSNQSVLKEIKPEYSLEG